MPAVWVAIQTHIYAVLQEMSIFSTGIAESLGLSITPATLITETGVQISIHSQVSGINEWLVITLGIGVLGLGIAF